jgi:hypothetical protein
VPNVKGMPGHCITVCHLLGTCLRQQLKTPMEDTKKRHIDNTIKAAHNAIGYMCGDHANCNAYAPNCSVPC